MQNHKKTEEVTLEPTRPLKRIYTLPSIKVLFPLNQRKSLSRKFTINSIKTYIPQYNENMTHNPSNHTLTEDELSVLTKDLYFVHTLIKIFKQETNKSLNKFKTRMIRQCFFFVITFIISAPPPPVLRASPVGHPLPLTTPL